MTHLSQLWFEASDYGEESEQWSLTYHVTLFDDHAISTHLQCDWTVVRQRLHRILSRPRARYGVSVVVDQQKAL